MRFRKSKRRLSLYVWHRYVGLVVLLIVISLAVTGIALNHTSRLRLTDRYVSSEALLNWYGIEIGQPKVAFIADRNWIIELDGRVFFNRKLIDATVTGLIGAVAVDGLIVIAASDAVLLLNTEGVLVDQVGDAQGFPAAPRRLGVASDRRIMVEAAHGLYAANKTFLGWQRVSEAAHIDWSRPSQPPHGLIADLRSHLRERVLSWERILLDVHSGRIVGRAGPYLVDAAAVFMMFLGISGFWLWLRQRHKKKLHRRKTGAAAAPVTRQIVRSEA
jgi:hypothetical protein